MFSKLKCLSGAGSGTLSMGAEVGKQKKTKISGHIVQGSALLTDQNSSFFVPVALNASNGEAAGELGKHRAV